MQTEYKTDKNWIKLHTTDVLIFHFLRHTKCNLMIIDRRLYLAHVPAY